eukprot:gnl/MRDRNA2_/MRDRNA2_17941_c0_seq1.p1 gnl/MRDRNA2_/MRDRNA2_17941_c0~~gnl/MRDRNA2_/MRDRNA2_17941_c0_seq1.p1  ORF type:complete len:913 (+),score=186.43 gnl/MRDRNA2_/MRDRNA2_17941_c0_seq1:391-2739(+)
MTPDTLQEASVTQVHDAITDQEPILHDAMMDQEPTLCDQSMPIQEDSAQPTLEAHEEHNWQMTRSQHQIDVQEQVVQQDVSHMTCAAPSDSQVEKDHGTASAFLANALSAFALRSHAAFTGPLVSIGEYFAKLQPCANLPSRAALVFQRGLRRSPASMAAVQIATSLPMEVRDAGAATLVSMPLGMKDSMPSGSPRIAFRGSKLDPLSEFVHRSASTANEMQWSVAVPPLPNPLCLATDLPKLVDEMLCSGAIEDFQLRSTAPKSVFGLPMLFRGVSESACGTLQMAHNAIAAEVFTRLSQNVSVAAEPKHSNSASNVRAEQETLKNAAAQATENLRTAKAQEAEARRALRALESSDAPSSALRAARDQIRILKKATATEETAERAAHACLTEYIDKLQPSSWHDHWLIHQAQDVEEEESFLPFAVRLTPNGDLTFTVQGFIDALRAGTSEGGTIVPMHALEMAFVTRAVDNLQLNVPPGTIATGDQDAERMYLPSAETTGAGIADPGMPCMELRTICPTHAIMISITGATFPFSICFGQLGSEANTSKCFFGVGVERATLAPRWSEWQSLEVLWEQDARQCLALIAVIASLAPVVLGSKPIGPLSHASNDSCIGEVPNAPNALVSIVQAALCHEVKAWPISQPMGSLLRWEFALRMLRFQLQRNSIDSFHPLKGYADSLMGESIPEILSSLKRVPQDTSLGSRPWRTSNAKVEAQVENKCSSKEEVLVETVLTDRLQRMEHSELLHTPFEAVSRFQAIVSQLSARWVSFLQDTATAPVQHT